MFHSELSPLRASFLKFNTLNSDLWIEIIEEDTDIIVIVIKNI